MTIQEFADVLDLSIEVLYYPNQKSRWSTKFKDCAVKDGCILEYNYGNGSNPTESLKNYIAKVSGKKMVFNAYGEDRKEFTVPESLTV